MPATYTRHGHATGGRVSSEYRSWYQMRDRCNNRNCRTYRLYGGRGIKVDPRWDGSFAAFFADMGAKPSPKHSLDRFPDKNGNYEPGNCRWATAKQQADNTNRNRVYTVNGETRNVKGWAKHIGITLSSLLERLDRMPPERALTLPPQRVFSRLPVRRLITFDGETKTLTDWATVLGWSVNGLHKRLARLPLAEALIPRNTGG